MLYIAQGFIEIGVGELEKGGAAGLAGVRVEILAVTGRVGIWWTQRLLNKYWKREQWG